MSQSCLSPFRAFVSVAAAMPNANSEPKRRLELS